MKIEVNETDKCYKLFLEDEGCLRVDGPMLKEYLDGFSDREKLIEVIIKDTPLITSSAIGMILKKITSDGFKVSILLNNQKAYEQLETLNLIELFNVTLIKS